MVTSFPTIFSDNDQKRFRLWQDRFRRSFPTMAKSFPRNIFRQWPSFPGNLFRQSLLAMAKSFPTIVSDNGQIASVNRFRQWSDLFRQSFPTMAKSFPTIISGKAQIFSEMGVAQPRELLYISMAMLWATLSWILFASCFLQFLCLPICSSHSCTVSLCLWSEAELLPIALRLLP